MELKGKLFHLFLITYVNSVIGALMSILGATFPDVQCVFNADIEEVSRLFLCIGSPHVITCFLFPVLVRKCHIYLLMAVAMLFYCVGVATVAVSPFIEVAVLSLLVAGSSVGVANLGIFHICNMLFTESDYAFHVLTSGLSAGSLASPIFAVPFLGSTDIRTSFHANGTITNTSEATMDTTGTHMMLFQQEPNIRMHTWDENHSLNCDSQCGHSSVKYLFVTIGLLGLPAATAYFGYFFKRESNLPVTPSSPDTYLQFGMTNTKLDVIFIVLFISCIIPSYGLPYTYGSYLTTVGTEGVLNLDLKNMTFLTSLFWLLFLLGRLVSTAISFLIPQIVILYMFQIGEVLMIILLNTVTRSETLFWIGSLSLGFFSAPVFPALLAWSREYITLSPRILGMLTLADCAGAYLLPFLCGQLISLYGARSQARYCLALLILQMAVVCVLHMIGSIMKSQTKKINGSKSNDEVP